MRLKAECFAPSWELRVPCHKEVTTFHAVDSLLISQHQESSLSFYNNDTIILDSSLIRLQEVAHPNCLFDPEK